ncbi:MAG: release factor glutamine methyltransferase [Planctomycetota bacterium]|jgi:release factor glutamine methyltransferase|uniref:peptide chain release factor N(5)-glutamine methyltransferase n=1 Tax=Patiriisocius sp. Uisw_047 TaxID=3230969 RepID=UPI0039ED6D46
MTFKEQRLAFAKILSNHYPQEEISSFFYLLTEHHFGLTKFETHQKDAEDFTEAKEPLFVEALQKLQRSEPIQYILGKTEFFGHPFKVNKHTLIPRPETEELVAWILADQKNNSSEIHILDIGTGSGCIAISLAKELENAKVSALDISKGALEVARENAKKNIVEVDFVQRDILTSEAVAASYDIIVSNPPYVRNLEKKMMQKNVLVHEPETALFVSDNDPLVFYRRIAQLARKNLKEGGFLYFEINEYLGAEMTELITYLGFKNCSIKKDIYGKDRMMRASL